MFPLQLGSPVLPYSDAILGICSEVHTRPAALSALPKDSARCFASGHITAHGEFDFTETERRILLCGALRRRLFFGAFLSLRLLLPLVLRAC